MSDKEDEEENILTDVDYGAIAIPDPHGNLPIDINTHIVPLPLTTFNNPYPYPPMTIDHTDEIKALKKEIQELKDIIAEHILLGHQDK